MILVTVHSFRVTYLLIFIYKELLYDASLFERNMFGVPRSDINNFDVFDVCYICLKIRAC